jgi:uncharacterized protein involved in exopolysaccharide biosynthesis
MVKTASWVIVILKHFIFGIAVSQKNSTSFSRVNEFDLQEGEIDISLILSIIYKDKFLIIFLSLFFALGAFGFSLTLPNKYKSTVILAPTQKDDGGQLGGLASQFGGIASIAGISLGKELDKTEQAIVLLSSWPFLEYIVAKYNLGPDIYAAKGFDKISKQLFYDESLYSFKGNEWVSSRFEATGGSPSSWMLFRKFNSLVEVRNDKKTGLLTVSITSISPILAKSWLEILIKELNLHFQRIDKEDAKRNVEYLEKKIAETSVAEMQKVFFNMIEAQTKVLVLTERSEEYLFRVVVPPMVPEEKDSPKRSLFGLVGFMFGVFVWLATIVWRFARGNLSAKANSGNF